MQNQERKHSPYELLHVISPLSTLNPECVTRTDCLCRTEPLYRHDEGGTEAVATPGAQKTEMGSFPRNLNPSVVCPA